MTPVTQPGAVLPAGSDITGKTMSNPDLGKVCVKIHNCDITIRSNVAPAHNFKYKSTEKVWKNLNLEKKILKY